MGVYLDSTTQELNDPINTSGSKVSFDSPPSIVVLKSESTAIMIQKFHITRKNCQESFK